MTTEPSHPRVPRSKPKLTPKQRRLIDEITEIAEAVRMDHWNILDYKDEARTSILEVMRQKFIRGEIIMAYTLIDEFLSVIISNYYFRRNEKTNSTFRRLWSTKKFRLFVHYFLDEAYLLNKMRMVHEIKALPSDVRNALERINALRNAIAHSFFPENRRQYKAQKMVTYQSTNIFSKDGIRKFLQDATLVEDHLMQQAFGVKPDDAAEDR
jgi:hypothetical protein